MGGGKAPAPFPQVRMGGRAGELAASNAHVDTGVISPSGIHDGIGIAAYSSSWWTCTLRTSGPMRGRQKAEGLVVWMVVRWRAFRDFE